MLAVLAYFLLPHSECDHVLILPDEYCI